MPFAWASSAWDNERVKRKGVGAAMNTNVNVLFAPFYYFYGIFQFFMRYPLLGQHVSQQGPTQLHHGHALQQEFGVRHQEQLV
jgi:hypothetical protein